MLTKLLHPLILLFFVTVNVGSQCLCSPDCDHEWHDMEKKSQELEDDDICRYRPNQSEHKEETGFEKVVNTFFQVCCERNFFLGADQIQLMVAESIHLKLIPPILIDKEQALFSLRAYSVFIFLETPPPQLAS